MRAPTTALDTRFSDPGASPTSWADTVGSLEAAELSWITTVRADGRSHVSPLVAVWLDPAVHFCTGAEEQKAVNLRSNPHVIVTTGCNQWDRGLDVVVEGDAVPVTGAGALHRLADGWRGKWDGRWQFEVGDGAFRHEAGAALVFSVAPTRVLAFGKGTFSHTSHPVLTARTAAPGRPALTPGRAALVAAADPAAPGTAGEPEGDGRLVRASRLGAAGHGPHDRRDLALLPGRPRPARLRLAGPDLRPAGRHRIGPHAPGRGRVDVEAAPRAGPPGAACAVAAALGFGLMSLSRIQVEPYYWIVLWAWGTTALAIVAIAGTLAVTLRDGVPRPRLAIAGPTGTALLATALVATGLALVGWPAVPPGGAEPVPTPWWDGRVRPPASPSGEVTPR